MSGAAPAEDLPLWRLPAMRLLVLVSVLGFVSFCLTLASLPSWALAGGVGPGVAGLVTTVMLVCTVLAQVTVPALVSRLGVGRTLAGGMVALGLPAPFLALGHDLGWLLGLSAVRGVGFAAVTVVGTTLTATVAAPERRGESVGVYGLAIAGPNLLAVPAGVALTQAGAFGWVALLAGAPVLGVPAALALGRISTASQAPRVDPAACGAQPPARSRRRRRAALAALAPAVVLLVVTLAGGGLVTFLPIGRPTGLLAASALIVFGAMAALGRWRAGMLADRTGTRRLLPGSLLTATVGLACVAAGLALGTGRAAALVVVLGAAVFGAAYGAVQNLTLVIAFAAVGPTRASAASALWNAAFDTGTGIGAAAVGAVAATGLGLPAALALSAGLITLSVPLALQRRRHNLGLRPAPG